MLSRKKRIRCIPDAIQFIQGGCVAIVLRASDQAMVRTSLVVRIDLLKKEIETLNSVYYWQ